MAAEENNFLSKGETLDPLALSLKLKYPASEQLSLKGSLKMLNEVTAQMWKALPNLHQLSIGPNITYFDSIIIKKNTKPVTA